MNSTLSAAPVTIEHLGVLSFFAGLDPARLAQIAPYTKRAHFEAGESVFEKGDLANRFYVVVSGRVEIYCKLGEKTMRVQEVGPGDAVGCSWFYTPEILHFAARAIEPVEAVFVYGTLLREECDLDPVLGFGLMQRTGRVLIRRLEAVLALLAKAIAEPEGASRLPSAAGASDS
jgi:CRP/FNR family transcriptional regulator, cyclic AMP receptor protein